MSEGIERARALTLRYLLASTAIFFAAGLLGMLLRTSRPTSAGSSRTSSMP